jgi:nicotinate-nucleotide adenylyltransferase
MEGINVNYTRNDILKLLSLSPRRYEHTLGTEKCALELARTHHPEIDPEKVSFCALLHDMTKEYSIDEHIKTALQYGISFEKNDLASPKLLHSKTASYICRYELKLDDDMCDAVFYHTTGRPAMTPLEEIIYLADYIEETRKDSECILLRKQYFELLAENSPRIALDKTLILSFDRTIYNLLEKGYLVDKNTIDARNYYVSKTLDNIK